MRERLAKLVLPILLFSLASCGSNDAETMGRLKASMAEVKASAETVLTGQAPSDRAGLAAISQRIGVADQAVERAEDTARSLDGAPALRAAALDYLKAVRGAVDHTRDRYATDIDLIEATKQDSTVSAAIVEAQDAAALERASADADAKASALAAAVNRAGNATVEHESRLGALMTAVQRNGQPLAGYALISNDALAAAMATNATPNRSTPVRAEVDAHRPARR